VPGPFSHNQTGPSAEGRRDRARSRSDPDEMAAHTFTGLGSRYRSPPARETS